jgi:transcriptional regulator with XRE-family HTH domain
MERYTRSVNKLKGDPPVNPFKYMRAVALHSKETPTLESLCNAMGISKQALIRTEQGTYVEPPQAIIEYYAEEEGADYVTLGRLYKEFQRDVRKRHYRIFGDLNERDFFSEGLHPFTVLRRNWTDPISGVPYAGEMNVTECAKLLCVPQGTLSYFQNKLTHQASVPDVLISALKDNGYTGDELDTLVYEYYAYRERKMGRTPELRRNPPVGNLIVRAGGISYG